MGFAGWCQSPRLLCRANVDWRVCLACLVRGPGDISAHVTECCLMTPLLMTIFSSTLKANSLIELSVLGGRRGKDLMKFNKIIRQGLDLIGEEVCLIVRRLIANKSIGLHPATYIWTSWVFVLQLWSVRDP